MPRAKTFLVVAAATLMFGCGGGGGSAPDGGGAPLPAASYDMDAAFARMLMVGRSFTGLKGTYAGTSIELTLSFSPAGDGPFRGQVYHRAIQATSASAGGGGQASTSQTMYFTADPVQLVAALDAAGPLTVFAMRGSLPRAGVAGDSGPFALATSYASAESATVIGQTALDWQLQPDTESTVWACLVNTLVGGGLSEQDCFRLDTAGNVSAARAVLVIDGQTVVLSQ